MRVLATGGNGFIDSAIVEALLAQGYKVLSVGRSQPEGFNHCSQLSYQTLNFNQATSAEQWQPLLRGIDQSLTVQVFCVSIAAMILIAYT